MPDIPTDQPQGELQPDAGSGISAQANPQALGENVAGAQWESGLVAQRVYHDANQAAVQQFRNSQLQWEANTLHDAKTGVLYQNSGLSAPGLVDKTLQNYQQFTAKATAGMNSAQQQLAQPYIQEHRAQLQDQLMKYEHGQVTDAHNEILQNGIALHANAATLHSDDPGLVDHDLKSMDALYQDWGRVNNIDPDKVARLSANSKSEAAYGMIRNLVANDKPQQAQAWMQANQGVLQGAQLTEATNMVKEKGNNNEALATANKILASSTDETDAYQKLDGLKITNAAVYDKANEELQNHFRKYKEATNERNGIIADKALTEMQSSPTNSVTAETWADVPSQLKPKLVLAQKQMVKNGYIETEPAAYWDFHQRIADAGLDTTKLNAIQPQADYPHQVSPTHMVAMQQEKQKAIEAATKRTDHLSQGIVAQNVTEDLFKENHLSDITAKPNTRAHTDQADANAALQGQFLMQLHRAVGAKQVDLERELTQPEIHEEATKLMASTSWIESTPNPDYRKPEDRSTLQTVLSGVFGAGDTQDIEKFNAIKTARYFETPAAQTRAYSIRDIPDTKDNPARSLLLKHFTAAGHSNPTEQEIIDAYNLAHSK